MPNQMPTWEEWKNLSYDQREYSQYKILCELAQHDSSSDTLCASRVAECGERFQALDGKIEKVARRKWLDKMVSAIIGAAVGVATAIGIRFGG